MKIDHIFILTAMPVVGFVVGIAYFQGLWLTISRYSGKKNFAAKLLGSFIVRLTPTLVIFYYCMQNDWKRLILMVGGFLIARQVMIRRIQLVTPSSNMPNMH